MGDECIREKFDTAPEIKSSDLPSENSGKNGWQHTVAKLAAMHPFEYDRCREDKAKELGVRVGTLDKEVAKTRGDFSGESDEGGRAMVFEEPQSWPEPVNGDTLLNDLTATFRRFLVLPEGAAEICALWTLHTWAHDAARISPILAISSPEKRCGKTTLLSLLKALVRRPLLASNVTPSALFRATELWRPTLLIDEADTFLKNSDELRGIINCGHTKDAAFVIRTVGDDHEPRKFSTWAPKAIALIGSMPATLTDRAIIIRMRRKTLEERAERLRLDRLTALQDLPRLCVRWVADNLNRLIDVDPSTPAGLNDRAADNWRPLFGIAQVAGGDWVKHAESIVLKLTGDEDGEEAASVMLLRDIKVLFDKRGVEHLPSTDLAEALAALEERPWPEWQHGKPISSRQIAKLLKPFEITPKNFRLGDQVHKGYGREQFKDAFARYLPNSSATPLQSMKYNGLRDVLSAIKDTP